MPEEGPVSVRPPSGAFSRAFLQRENVLFEEPFESDQYWRVMEAACFLPDLRILLGGDLTEVPECRSHALRVGDIRKSGDRKQDVKPDVGKLQTAVHLRAPSRRQKFQGSWDSHYMEERGGAGGQADASHRRSEIRFAKGGNEGKKMEDDARGFLTRSTSSAAIDGVKDSGVIPHPAAATSKALVLCSSANTVKRQALVPHALWSRGAAAGDRGASGGARGFAGGGGDEIRVWCSSTVFWGLNSRAVSYAMDGGSTVSASAHRRRSPRVLAQVSVNKRGGEWGGRGSGSERSVDSIAGSEVLLTMRTTEDGDLPLATDENSQRESLQALL
ncbi:hypothetical protein B0H19DRAFT_1074206 [Mycena capillaripes]|nr:hypothetical protein B0H19DRAFT_1074206 [Mycena capillaripes]